MIGVVIQARLGSTRLPRKALLPFGSGTLLESALRRLARVPAAAYVLATEERSAPEFRDLAARLGFSLFIGPEDDVLARYCGAIRAFHLDVVVRATGDNPFVNPEAASALLADPQVSDADYASYQGLPLGQGVEIVKAAALLNAEAESRDPYEREHVCPFLYRRPERFRLYRPMAPKRFLAPDARVTVDTAEDYRWACTVLAACGEDPSSDVLARWLRAAVRKE
jgi:spore coat polysaccharide biosynthesis protein SpsF